MPQKSRIVQVPLPTGGWDAISRLTAIPKDRAISLINMIPTKGGIEFRKGFASHATGLTSAAVDSLMVWEGFASRKMFAAVSASIFDVTSAGAVGAAVVSGLASDRFQWTHFSNSAGSYLYIVNGADAPYHYNGTAWANPSITGVTAANLISVMSHKRRVWFIEKDTANAWYLPVDAVAGAAVKLDLGPLFSRGGHLLAFGRWSRDAGDGPDDYAVFLSSRGQAVVYAGTDPDFVDSWGLASILDLPTPVGARRCISEFGGDLLINTVAGVVSLEAAARYGLQEPERIIVNHRIANEHKSVVSLYSANFGWGITHFKEESLLLINVPTAEGTNAVQHVLNTQTSAWCKFDGFKATSMVVFGGSLYFGSSGGIVYKALSGLTDNGANIVARSRGAYGDLGYPGRVKHATMVLLALESQGTVLPAVAFDADFEYTDPTDIPPVSAGGSDVWDTGLWDTAVWGTGGDEPYLNWTGVGAIGHVLSMHVKFEAKNVSVRLNGADLMIELGGPL